MSDNEGVTSDLSVLPVKPSKDAIKCNRPFNPILPDADNGCCVLIVSPVRTGKSTLVSNLLLNDNFYRDCTHEIICPSLAASPGSAGTSTITVMVQ